MKKLFLLFGASLAAVVAIVVVLLATREQAPDTVDMTPKITETKCPFEYTFAGTPQNASPDGLSTWMVFVSDYHKTAPQVSVSVVPKDAVPGLTADACKLDITRVPGAPLEGVDWRIGTIVAPLPTRGKNATVSFRLRADREITFEAGQIYLYDGKTVVDAPLGVLNTEWRTFTIQHPMPMDTIAAEVWLRLTIHGKISQTGTVYMTDVKLAVD